jgi:hypothetical protein
LVEAPPLRSGMSISGRPLVAYMMSTGNYMHGGYTDQERRPFRRTIRGTKSVVLGGSSCDLLSGRVGHALVGASRRRSCLDC